MNNVNNVEFYFLFCLNKIQYVTVAIFYRLTCNDIPIT